MSEVGPAGARPHRRILASAGCGKTYALTTRFLELVHRGEAPASILASTFSKAAAAEIRDRVLRRAAEAVLSEKERAELGRALGNGDLSPAAARALLERLVAALPALQIRTIDSLFAGVTVAFAAELGLPQEPRILEPGEQPIVLRAAIARCLAELPEEEVLETLVSLARGTHNAAVVPTMERAIGDLVPLILDSAVGAWDWEDPRGPADDELDAAVAELERLGPAAEKKSIQKAVREDLARLMRARDEGGDHWKGVLTKGLVDAIRSGRDTYGRAKVPADLRAAYAPVVDAAWAGVRRTYAFSTHATRDLLRAVVSRLRAEKLHRGVVSFEDLTRSLDPAASADLPALDEIWFRLDARVRHLLLDEFQDTSAAQWRALRPIAGEIGAHGDGSRSLFAVGDVKQSIYGWRGGEPGILDRLGEVTIEDGVVDFETSPLDRSYRSAPEVIAAVNAVFSGVAENPVVCDLSPRAARQWGEWFTTHETTKDDLAGFARFVELPLPGDEEKPGNVRVLHAAAAACRHWDRLRGTDQTVAVLVRRNANVARVVAALKRQGVPANGRGGGSLFDAEAVLATVQALRLAEHPDDLAAAFDLASSPLAELVGFGGGTAPPRAEDRRRVSDELRARLRRRGAAAVVDGLRRRLGHLFDGREEIRMRQLVRTLARLEDHADRSPGELVTLLQAAAVDEPGGEGVTVMNVHQSKGLEFDVVIATELDRSILPEGSQAAVAWSSPARPAEPIPRVVRWVKQDVRWPEVTPLHEDTEARFAQESLCALYVALTRAKRGLEVHVEPVTRTKDGDESKQSGKSTSAVVRAALSGAGAERGVGDDGLPVLWACGQEAVAATGVPVGEAGEAAPPRMPEGGRLRVAPTAGRRARRARPASGRDEDRRVLFEAWDAEASERGRALHACFEQVGWLDVDGLPTDTVLRDAVRRAVPAGSAEWTAERLAEFETALRRPELREVLTKGDARADTRREHRYVRWTAAGLEEGAIDRLVLHRDEAGDVVRADVLDFKTGAASAPETVVRRYGAQLRAYREVVAEQFGLGADAIRMRVAVVGAGVVVDVPVE